MVFSAGLSLFPETNSVLLHLIAQNLNFSLTKKISSLIISNLYFNSDYIDTNLVKLRSNTILESLEKEAIVNTNLKPIAYFYEINRYLSLHEFKIYGIFISLLICLFIFIKGVNKINLGLFTSGFSGASAEFMLIFSFQAIFSSLYQNIGLILTLFMAGIFTGSLLLAKAIKLIRAKHYYISLGGMILLSFTFPLYLIFINSYHYADSSIKFLFFVFAFIFGNLTGLQFAIASILQPDNIKKKASGTYSIDMAGAAAGALLTSVNCCTFNWV